ncbi:hypothetical protein BKA83DRAFT_4303554 [Pisolithus microcarpus]|nr:hypothetical protein BKA83DRAFT_4303554 [Pisolithus microcarpus]
MGSTEDVPRNQTMKEKKLDNPKKATISSRVDSEVGPLTSHYWLSTPGSSSGLLERCGQPGAVADLKEIVALGQVAPELCPLEGQDHYKFSPACLALPLLTALYKKVDKIGDLDKAITSFRAALEFQHGSHERSFILNGLAFLLVERYNKQGAVADLEEAIALRCAVPALNPSEAQDDHKSSLVKLTLSLAKIFLGRSGHTHDLDEAITMSRAILENSHENILQSTIRNLLVLLHMKRFNSQQAVADLEEVATLGPEVLQLERRDGPLFDLMIRLAQVFRNRSTIEELNEAISSLRAMLEHQPPRDRMQLFALIGLASALAGRYKKQGATVDLDEAVVLGRTASKCCLSAREDCGDVDVTRSYLARLHRNLADALHGRFKRERRINDLNEAITSLRIVLEFELEDDKRRIPLLTLASYLSTRYNKQRIVADLEEAVTLGRTALDLCPPGRPDRGVFLRRLACDLWMKFQEQADMPGQHGANSFRRTASVVRRADNVTLGSLLLELSLRLWDRHQERAMMIDLHEVIRLATYALELRLPRDSRDDAAWVQRLAQRTDSSIPAMFDRQVEKLGSLVNCFVREGSRNQYDLKEAVMLCRCVLQFRPTGNSNRASSLHDLAQCLADRFRQTRTEADLDEAISLEQEVIQLRTPGDPGYDISRQSLADYLKMMIYFKDAAPSTDASAVTRFDVEQTIHNVVSETLKTMPTRLLHTHTGALCDREAQIAQFMKSQQYNQLLTLCTNCDMDRQMELIRTTVSRYFRFVTLSHRWGKGEPLLRDIEGRRIYGMPVMGGFRKLQMFCTIAFELDYLWAWSDTCCIDKDSSAELQEAIGLMFTWYRRSALTIVHLSDVPETGSFEGSEWFRRGWTLQELLAPCNILFYTQNWSLYKNLTSSNHKADASVQRELERVTGINSRFLTNFSPGTDDARSRLQWASSRHTTRPEDVAYSLFGIFNLHLPVLYGEPAESALGRLLAEITSQSRDISILDWIGKASSFHSCFPADITSYRTLLQPNTEERSSTRSGQPTPIAVLQKLCGPLATSLRSRFVRRPLTSSSVTRRVSAAGLQAPNSYPPSDVYDFYSLNDIPLPRFVNHRLALPCIAHPIIAIPLTRESPSVPSYTYNIRAFGLRPLQITLPDKLEGETRSRGALQLVRPWHSQLLGPSTEVDGVSEEQLLSALEKPFSALLLIQLRHNEFRRIASSTLISAQPTGRASILQSKARIFNIV